MIKFSSFLVIFLFTFLFHGSAFSAILDLEEKPDDFILETKQIHIPGYPHAFNPSIVRWNEKIIMSFRLIPHSRQIIYSEIFSTGESFIGLVFLNEKFDPISEVQILNLGNNSHPSCAEDARLLTVGNDLYMIYSDNIDSHPHEDHDSYSGGFRIVVSQLDLHKGKFIITDQERICHFEGEKSWRREKNWVPFNYLGNLLFAYSISPHKILFPFLDGSGICETICTTYPDITWKWGEIRGSTPALLINRQEYLSFFHSSMEMQSIHSESKPSLHYFIGAYTFSSELPFNITHISPKPIIAKGFYKGKTYPYYWKPVNVIFPCGFLVEEPYIWLSYGRQDHEIWIAKINKKALLHSLIPVK